VEMWEKRLQQISDSDRERIWLLHDQGVNMVELAARFHCSPATISRELSNRRQRTNVTAPARANQVAQSACIAPSSGIPTTTHEFA
jgi:IS30 family transposase